MRAWRTAYRAAILSEATGSALEAQISVAEEAIVMRSRELFNESGVDAEVEREAIEDSLYALQAFRKAVEHADKAA